MAETIKVAVAGAAGKMGQHLCAHVAQASGLELVLVTDRSHVGENLREVAGKQMPSIVIEDKIGAGIERTGAQVLVDFTHPGCACDHAMTAMNHKCAAIIGTSGIHNSQHSDLADHAKATGIPAMLVPNFALGAVLMMRFAEMAAKWLPHVEIIELHHDAKADAPSGTAKATAEKIAANRHRSHHKNPEIISVEGVRGGSYRDVPIHSIRMRGLMAHQEVMFGALGQVLSIRHDAMDRTSYMPGVELAIRNVWKTSGLTIGLEQLLFNNAIDEQRVLALVGED